MIVTNKKNYIGLGVLISGFVFSLMFVQSVRASCTYWNGQALTSQVPSWAGMFYDVFNTTAFIPLLSVSCPNSGTAKISVGKPGGTTYTYEIAYIWLNGTWKKVTLTEPEAGSQKVYNVWFNGPAKADVAVPMSQNSSYYFVGYTCQYVNNAWKCGCRDTTCATKHWQLSKFTWYDPPPQGGLVCSVGGNTVAYADGCSCQASAECGSGYCSSGLCAPRPAGVSQACSLNLQCNGTETCNDGFCGIKSCNAHAECSAQRICDSGQCVLARGCYEDSHCPPSESCLRSQGACVPR
jgi:hypothetical protein